MLTIYTICFNIVKLYIVFTQSIYVFRMILRINQ